MIAAISPSGDRVLELFKLVLKLKSAGADIPPRLSKHFENVLNKSLSVAEKPEENLADASIEALALGLRIKSDDELRQLLTALLAKDGDPQPKASEALSSLENSFDATSESAHLTREIYATI